MPDHKNVFRKSSLERISSPEKLNEYIRVSKPSIWVILCVIVILFAAFGFWGATAVITDDGLRPIDFLINSGQ